MLFAYLLLGLTEIGIIFSRKKYTALVFAHVVALSFSGSAIALGNNNAFSYMIGAIGIFRALSLARLVESRMHTNYLRKITIRTSLTLLTAQAAIGAAWILYETFNINVKFDDIIIGLAALQLIAAVIIATICVKNITKTAFRAPFKSYSDNELPTVSVAIPARNETDALGACIDHILASDYPKLEVLVLDDCSQDKTPEIIKRYAQSGVRFLKGDEPKLNWLARNQAYDQLADAANGKFVIFCSADTILASDSVRNLVTMAIAKHKSMVCVMPKRKLAKSLDILLQPLRYWWELALPRVIVNRPAVSSSFWLIDRKTLKSFGGFDAVSRSVQPEAFFARKLVPDNKYSLVRSSNGLDVVTNKSFNDQISKAVRLRYPEVHRRIEMVALLVIVELLLLAGPFAVLAWAIISSNFAVIALSLLASLVLIFTNARVIIATNTNFPVAAIVNLPLSILLEIYLGIVSLLRYEFGAIEWKDRNICLPAMHATPKHPKLVRQQAA